MQSFPERQYDITRTRGDWITIPHGVPYRQNAMDFAFFNYDSTFPAHLYNVAVESASNASPNPADRFRVISRLSKKVELPDVMFSQGFGSHAKILVLPASAGLPAFMGNLVRGSTYTIVPGAKVISTAGHRALARTGSY